MSDSYKRFINHFRAVAVSNGMGYDEVAETMNVHPNTVRSWWAFRSVMDGDAVLRCIQLILGGYKW